MKILLVSATTMEIAPALRQLEASGFSMGGSTASVLITGVGQAATAFRLGSALSAGHIQLVIQAGIAGSFGSQHAPGSVVYVQQDAFGDLGMEEHGRFTTIFENGLGNADEPPFTGGWLVNPDAVPAATGIPAVRGITVNKVTDSPLQRQQLLSSFAPGVESMEGAALHYACLVAGVPFAQLRAISNEVGVRDKSRWHLQAAIANLNDVLMQFIRYKTMP